MCSKKQSYDILDVYQMIYTILFFFADIVDFNHLNLNKSHLILI